ncbi:hypothetical protein HB799_06080 [Listeria welshimeri]|nr:hypothetical protein [Listeria welshimeri]
MPRLVNEDLQEMEDNVIDYKKNLTEAMYEQYKNAFILSQTINIRGASGNVLKEYMGNVQCNLTEKIINISDELAVKISDVKNTFLEFETQHNGIVGTGTINSIKAKMVEAQEEFSSSAYKANNVINDASAYISVVKLNTTCVIDAFNKTANKLDEIKGNLESADENVKTSLVSLKNRICDLNLQITDVNSNYRNAKGIIPEKLQKLKNETWYSNETGGLFSKMFENDPFVYAAGTAALAEEQWVGGMNENFYGQIYTSGVGASGDFKYSDGGIVTSGKAQLFNVNASAQISEYGNLNGNLNILGGSGKFDLTNKGLDANAEVYGIKVDGTASLGTDDYNGFINGEASIANAEANVTFEADEIAAGAHASWARAEGNAGLTIAGYEVSGGGSVGVQAGGGFSISSTGISIDGALIFGIDLKIKFP